jgi:hypothetical protein
MFLIHARNQMIRELKEDGYDIESLDQFFSKVGGDLN